LAASDSVHLVLDGRHLLHAVTDHTRRDIERAGGLVRMRSLLRAASAERAAVGKPPSSVVIQITKADLIPPWRLRQVDVLVHEMRSLLDVCFAQGVAAFLCPVSVGRFGLEPHSTVPAGKVTPVGVHLPMLFSLAQHLSDPSCGADPELAELADAALACCRGTAGRREPGERAPGERAPGERAPGERARALFADLVSWPRFRNGSPER
jgi:hypothetical protein